MKLSLAVRCALAKEGTKQTTDRQVTIANLKRRIDDSEAENHVKSAVS